MQVYLPIAEMPVSAELIVVIGTAVGFLSGVFGVGGGFLATPLLIFLGIPPAVSVGTQANQIVAASLSGVLGHFVRGNVDVRMGLVMLSGSLVGSLLGVFLFKLLSHFGRIDIVISLLYISLLGAMGFMMAKESLHSLLRTVRNKGDVKDVVPLHLFLESLPYKLHFPKSKLYISVLVPIFIGMLGGLLVSLMGIGGGFFLVPAMIYILGMPTLLAAGTSLFQIFFTTAFTTLMHAVTNHNIDLVLAVLLIAGGVVGAQIGVRVARHIKGAYARLVLASLMLVIVLKMLVDIIIQPQDLYSVVLLR